MCSLVDAHSVMLAVGALLRLKGCPDEQLELVQSMTPEMSAVVCRWIVDPNFWDLAGDISWISFDLI